MSESATGGAPAEGAPEPASGGTASGGVPEGYVPRAELDQIESRRRSLQSELDQTKARLTALEAAPKPPATETQGNAPAFDASAASALFRAEMARERAITDARAKLSQELPLADPSVLSGDYETAEELVAAAKHSHDSVKALHERIESETRASVLAEVKQKHGIDLAPPPQTTSGEGEGGGKSDPSVQDLASMSFGDFLAVDPKVANAAVLRS